MSEEPRHLVAVPSGPGHDVTHAEPSGPPVYADIRQPGERKQILPVWLASREQMKHSARRVRGYAWHAARFHGLRLPLYVPLYLFWAAVGVFRLAGRQIAWWWVVDAMRLEAAAARNGDSREWKGIHLPAKKTRKYRGYAIGAEVFALVVGVFVVRILAPWWVPWAVACVAVPVLAWYGRPDGRRIVQPSHVPQEFEVLTQDVITRALGALGLAGINQWLREGREIDFTGPVREDGPGYRAEMNLPYGTSATMIIDKREQLASGLRRPLGAVWPEPVTSEHPGRLELWVGHQDVAKRKPATWPLLKSGAVDVFQPVAFSTDMRGRTVKAPLIYHNWLIGSMPRNGKTAAVRVLNCAIALDPLCELWIHELKGTGDLDPLEVVSHRFVSGIDDDSIAYAAESLKLLRAEFERRSPRIRELPLALCPDKKVTRDIAQKHRDLRPLGCTIDECQNLFDHPKYGKEARSDAEWLIKVGPAVGIFLILATQRPDKNSLPTGVSGNSSIRFCLYVAGQVENDMILGTSAYHNGIRATLFRPEIDAGLGYLKGATPSPKVVRTYFLDVPAAKTVVARARAARERAGTLSGVAAEQDGEDGVRDVLGDVMAVFNGDPGLHWELVAARLSHQFPDRWADATADAVSAQCRDLQVPSVSVRWPTGRLGAVKKGCRRDDVESAAERNTAGQMV